MRIATACLAFLMTAPAGAALDWDSALKGEHRAEQNSIRDGWRHPRKTLEFFGIREGMSVVELSPSGGWYTEVLAPLLNGNGTYYAAHYSVNSPGYNRRNLGGYLQKLGEDDAIYGEVVVTVLAPPDALEIAPAGSADLVLAFRNVHSWMGIDALAEVFTAAFTALKPGAVFGVVQHRAKDGLSVEQMKKTGYISEDYVIAAARTVGFRLDARSNINANPKDTADHEEGVWELPPGLRGDESGHAAKLAIGESDRMTLRFVKPKT
jgi:predicted methyltransferase